MYKSTYWKHINWKNIITKVAEKIILKMLIGDVYNNKDCNTMISILLHLLFLNLNRSSAS